MTGFRPCLGTRSTGRPNRSAARAAGEIGLQSQPRAFPIEIGQEIHIAVRAKFFCGGHEPTAPDCALGNAGRGRLLLIRNKELSRRVNFVRLRRVTHSFRRQHEDAGRVLLVALYHGEAEHATVPTLHESLNHGMLECSVLGLDFATCHAEGRRSISVACESRCFASLSTAMRIAYASSVVAGGQVGCWTRSRRSASDTQKNECFATIRYFGLPLIDH